MDNNQNSSKETEIDLVDLCFELLSKFWIILIAGVIGLAASFIYFKWFVTPSYSAQTDVYVKFESATSTGQATTSSTGITIATNIAKDYQMLMTNDIILGPVREQLGVSSVGSIKVTSTDNTRVITVKVTHSDPKLAAEIANTICSTAKVILPDITGVDINQLAPAVEPGAPTGPNVTKNAILGFFIGAVLACMVIVVLRIFNDKIKTGDDIEKRLGLSVLGDIPNIYDQNRRLSNNYNRYGRLGRYRYNKYGYKYSRYAPAESKKHSGSDKGDR